MPPTTVRDPYDGWVAITVGQLLPDNIRAIYVGASQDITMVDRHGNTCVFKSVPIGEYRWRPRMVTVASSGYLVGLY